MVLSSWTGANNFTRNTVHSNVSRNNKKSNDVTCDLLLC